MARSLKKGPFVDSKLQTKVEKMNDAKTYLSTTISLNFDEDPKGARLSKVLDELSTKYRCEGARMAITATSWEELEKRFNLANEAMEDEEKWGFLAGRHLPKICYNLHISQAIMLGTKTEGDLCI